MAESRQFDSVEEYEQAVRDARRNHNAKVDRINRSIRWGAFLLAFSAPPIVLLATGMPRLVVGVFIGLLVVAFGSLLFEYKGNPTALSAELKPMLEMAKEGRKRL